MKSHTNTASPMLNRFWVVQNIHRITTYSSGDGGLYAMKSHTYTASPTLNRFLPSGVQMILLTFSEWPMNTCTKLHDISTVNNIVNIKWQWMVQQELSERQDSSQWVAMQKASNNKHSESIAKAIQVPYRPQQICKRHYSYKSRWKGPKWYVICIKLVQNNPKNSSHYLTRRHKTVRKTNLKQRAIITQ